MIMALVLYFTMFAITSDITAVFSFASVSLSEHPGFMLGPAAITITSASFTHSKPPEYTIVFGLRDELIE